MSTKYLFIKFAIFKDLLIILLLSFNSLGVEEVYQSMDHVLVEVLVISMVSKLLILGPIFTLCNRIIC